MPRKLAVVPPGAKPPTRAKALTVREAADDSERALLVALRSTLAKEVDSNNVPAHALAAVVRQLRELDHDIRALDARLEEESDDGAVPDDVEFAGFSS